MAINSKIAEIVFPNPCSLGFCQVNLSQNIDNALYQIVDLSGKLMLSGYFPFKVNMLDIRTLENGLYFLRINNGLLAEIIPLTVIR